MTRIPISQIDFEALAARIKSWGDELGFQKLGIADVDLGQHEAYLQRWLANGYQGEMGYMAAHGSKRSRPAELVPGTIRIITARLDYWPEDAQALAALDDPNKAYISRYSLGRDYHKVIRKRLQKLAHQIEDEVGPFGYRAFVDSAPVLEKALAAKSGLGWIGKHTLVLDRNAGSYFFLGELFTDLPLPVDEPVTAHCGTCSSCIDVCPTDAIVAPHQLDARQCISYLTIELKGAIPEPLRKPMGNRVFGCDDCQLFCPWNKFAQHTAEGDFTPRHNFKDAELADLFLWDEATFLKKTEGMPIRRTGFEGWLRNLAVALGNAPSSEKVIHALKQRADHPSELVREHVQWALAQHGAS